MPGEALDTVAHAVGVFPWEAVPADEYEHLKDCWSTLIDVCSRAGARLAEIEAELAHPSQQAPVRHLRSVP